jgi:hypothetical protein
MGAHVIVFCFKSLTTSALTAGYGFSELEFLASHAESTVVCAFVSFVVLSLAKSCFGRVVAAAFGTACTRITRSGRMLRLGGRFVAYGSLSALVGMAPHGLSHCDDGWPLQCQLTDSCSGDEPGTMPWSARIPHA